MCGYIPTTLPKNDPEQRVPLLAATMSASFVLETLIHTKEKVSIAIVLFYNRIIDYRL